MLFNYFKIAIRNIRKNPGYSFLNIAGLAIGLCCFIMITAYIHYEINFDRFNEKADRTYRVVHQQPDNFYMGTNHFAVSPVPLAQAMINDFPEIEQSMNLGKRFLFMSVDGQSFHESGIIASPYFFDVFTMPLSEGNPQTALSSPSSIVLTKDLALKVFGDENPMGKTITTNDGIDLTVTGLIDDVPAKSHFDFDFIMPAMSDEFYASNVDEWRNSGWYTYIVLKEGADVGQVQAKLPEFISKYSPNNHSYYLQALTDIHLRSNINFELSANNNIKYIYLFAGIAFLVLLLAAINYMNLAVAQSIKRTKEVGLRKVVGAQPRQLVLQFMSESMLLTFIALCLALFLSDLALPLFDGLVERPLDLSFLQEPFFLALILGCTLGAGLISGSYPALIATRFLPRNALAGAQDKGFTRYNLRNLLIIGQFTASIMLAIGSIVIYQQLGYIQTTEMGYDRDHILTLRIQDPKIQEQFDAIRQQLLQRSSIIQVAASDQLPNNIDAQTVISGWEGSEDIEREQPIYITGVDHNFTDLYDLEIVQGRNFTSDNVTERAQGAYLLNETAVKALGWELESAVGKKISAWGGEGIVVGVVQDFHMHSIHMPIQPLTMYLQSSSFRHISLKLQPSNLPETLKYITETFSEFSDYPISFTFLDDMFNQQYKTEIKLGEIVGYFTLLALFIAVLGLLGLTAYSAEQRTKEIGIRKVLGASVAHIVGLISKDFIQLVAIGFVLAIPIAWFAMNRWLQDFAYRIEIGPGVFLLAGGAAVLIAIATISWHSVKVAMSNPVDSLRSE
jgi:putative ABC transport system permease protein